MLYFFVSQALENNLYRAPMYEHVMPATDFLIIRTNNRYSSGVILFNYSIFIRLLHAGFVLMFFSSYSQIATISVK